MAVDDVAVVP